MYCFVSSRERHTRCALVTGVQTCALPISAPRHAQPSLRQRARDRRWSWGHTSVHHPGRTAAAIAEQARTEALIARLRVVPGRGEPRSDVLEQGSSEERRVGKGCVSQCRFRLSPAHKKKKTKNQKKT